MVFLFRISLIISMLAGFIPALSQHNFSKNNFYEISAGIGKRQGIVALSWTHIKGLGKNQRRFRLGYGLRFSAYGGKDQAFITAPARLTSRQTGPQVLFSKTYEESLDTVTFSTAQVNALNIAIYIEYAVSRRLEIGFNIDALGFSFGNRMMGRLKSSIRPSDISIDQSGKPTLFNVLLVSDNDIGSLYSELLLRYWIDEKIGVRAGFAFYFAEYTTDNKLIFDNDRYRNKVSMFQFGLTYNPFKTFNK
jgi:hypothetical protein